MRTMLSALVLAIPALAAVNVDGVRIHFTSTGKGPKTVILVHGWTCDETAWSEQVPALAAHYRVVTLDLPGHGKSGATKDGKYSMDLFARAVEAVRKNVKADRVILAGHSMGTPVVVQYARLYPQHTAALVFVDGPLTLMKFTPPPLTGPEGRKSREMIVRGLFKESTPPSARDKIERMMLAAPESTAQGAMQAMFDPAIWKNDVLSMPILGLYAEQSPVGDRAYIKEHFPNMEYTEIAGTGHFLMIEKPEEFNRLLAAFLDKQ